MKKPEKRAAKIKFMLQLKMTQPGHDPLMHHPVSLTFPLIGQKLSCLVSLALDLGIMIRYNFCSNAFYIFYLIQGLRLKSPSQSTWDLILCLRDNLINNRVSDVFVICVSKRKASLIDVWYDRSKSIYIFFVLTDL